MAGHLEYPEPALGGQVSHPSNASGVSGLSAHQHYSRQPGHLVNGKPDDWCQKPQYDFSFGKCTTNLAVVPQQEARRDIEKATAAVVMHRRKLAEVLERLDEVPVRWC
jgi:hypothetical protein